MRWTDSIIEAIGRSPQGLSRAVKTGHGGYHSLRGSPGVGADLTAHHTHTVL